MKRTKSEQIRTQLQRVRERIESERKLLENLETELKMVQEQEEERKGYINSKEITQVISSSTGKSVDMSTIKRWADKGYLGVVLDEREKFSLLDTGSGKQRNVYKRSTVLPFLLDRHYIQPAFSVLDFVAVQTDKNELQATVVSAYLGENGFEYNLQLEDDVRILEGVPEEELEPADGSATEDAAAMEETEQNVLVKGS